MIFIAALATLTLTASTTADELKKLSLDNASSIALKIQTDSRVKIEGRGSIKITTPWPTTICLAEVTGLNVEDAKLVYKAEARSLKLAGRAYLEMWCHFKSGQYFSKGFKSVVTGTMDWKTLETPFFLKKGQRPEKITLNIVINGKGTVWIDNIVLSKEALK